MQLGKKQHSPFRIILRIITVIIIGLIVGAIVWGLRWWGNLDAGDADDLPPLESGAVITPGAIEPTATSYLSNENQAQILIPAAGVLEAIVESYLTEDGWDVASLGSHVGHLQGTAWVGQPGNIALAGHVEMADGSKGIFAHIGELEPGDRVTLAQNGIEYHYSVREVKVVDADDLSVIMPTEVPTVTLITCADYNFLKNTYEKRVVVIAEQTG